MLHHTWNTEFWGKGSENKTREKFTLKKTIEEYVQEKERGE